MALVEEHVGGDEDVLLHERRPPLGELLAEPSGDRAAQLADGVADDADAAHGGLAERLLHLGDGIELDVEPERSRHDLRSLTLDGAGGRRGHRRVDQRDGVAAGRGELGRLGDFRGGR